VGKKIIEVKDVWKVYQMGNVKVEALRGLDFSVSKGEFVSIIGPSGSGKSTAMNMIGCLDVPSKGTVFLDGKDISKMTESQLAQVRGKKIGFIFQSFNLVNTLTAKENIMLPMLFQSLNREQREKRAERLLRMVELDDRMDHKPTELSGGQQQRVAIARALSNNPEVILADEPTGNLDSKTGKSMMDFLKKLHKKENRTIVVVTHDKYIAENADRVNYLKDGMVEKER